MLAYLIFKLRLGKKYWRKRELRSIVSSNVVETLFSVDHLTGFVPRFIVEND